MPTWRRSTAVLTDALTGARTPVSLSKTATTYTWPRLPGAHAYTVEVVASDANGLTSTVVTGSATTAADDNGAPPAIPLASITVTPKSTSSVEISFPRPVLPDLKSIGYDIRPVGAAMDPADAIRGLSISSATVKGTVVLPTAGTAYQLVIYVFDHNGNRSRTSVPSVQGAPNASELPSPHSTCS